MGCRHIYFYLLGDVSTIHYLCKKKMTMDFFEENIFGSSMFSEEKYEILYDSYPYVDSNTDEVYLDRTPAM